MEGKVCVITGASKGVGRGIAKTLGSKGVFVVLVARGQDALDNLLKEIQDEGGKGMTVACSISDREGIKAMASKVISEVGVPDFLVNNAGAWMFQSFVDNDYESWDWMIDVNIRGHLNAISAFLPAMKEKDKGHIINITSDSERVPFPGVAVYTGTKFFMDGCMQCLRMELKGTKIKITNVLPGFVWTDGLERTLRDPVQAKAMKDMGLGDPELFIEKKDLMIQPEDLGITVYDVMKSGDNYYIHDVMVRDKLQEMV
eukprot:TRINITY_DN38148_c0_g1_i1.p1 TRINITY_DN38148_c0_g1~~TRINITY_DN38148_c0_g1_i1.p1  ORF type:complete len:269 (+),score=65.58 TRINITY_DN38148_c0_g1_i1:39-809(+)